MFERLKNIWFHPTKTSVHTKVLLASQCTKLPRMADKSFEVAEQLLEPIYDWYDSYELKGGSELAQGGFHRHALESQIGQEFWLRQLSDWLNSAHLPVVMTNCHESIVTNLTPLVANGSIGVISIGHQFNMTPTLEMRPGSAYHFALSRYEQLQYLGLGIDEELQTISQLDYAEDMNCYWLTRAECNLRHRQKLKDQLFSFGEKVDQIVIDIDLASIVANYRYQMAAGIDIQWLTKVLRYCLASGKVRFIQLVGDKEYLLYSRPVKQILELILQSEKAPSKFDWPQIA